LQAINDSQRSQIILIGIEAHVCVLETAIELQESGKQVFVVVDAVSSRHELNLRYGLKRVKSVGIQLVTREMVFFEWIRAAGTPEFKQLSQDFLR
jgi:nicotinamidase-related amidase